MQQSQKYTRPAVFLHWLIAALIFGNIALGLTTRWAPDSWVRSIVDLHKSIGISVLMLFVFRLMWRLGHRPPPLLAGLSWLERTAAHAVHILLYVLIFALPMTGWIHDSAWAGAPSHPMKLFGVIPWFRLGFITGLDATTKDAIHSLFGNLHDYCGYALYAVLALHILGAFKHQFIDRKPEIQRMWF